MEHGMFEEAAGAKAVVDKVLRGAFMTENYDVWKIPSFNLRYFVSSTFTDTHNERDLMRTSLLKQLNKNSKAHNVSITFVDMRWGVKDENTDDHKTWDLCKQELENCCNASTESFFISLQGNKYGYRPLPRDIEKKLFDEHLLNYKESDSEELILLARKWYILDQNYILPKYVLVTLNESNRTEYWKKAYGKLLKLLTGLCFDTDYGLYVGDSVTSWEATCGLRYPNRFLWFRRNIIEPINAHEDLYRNFDDVQGNVDITNRYNNLIHFMTTVGARMESIDIDKLSSIHSKSNAYTTYIKDFYDILLRAILAELDAVIRKKSDFNAHAYGTDLPGDCAIDFIHHYSWARQKVLDFKSRKNLLNTILRCIGSSKSVSPISCCIIGKSGSGKTCLMAKVASILCENYRIPIIIRFCGTNDHSSSGLKLLTSICKQIHYIYNINATIPATYVHLVEYFNQLLTANPFILIIDSIDQLSNDNQERSHISFFNGTKPHKETIIILSCLPDDINLITGTGYWYGCETTLKRWNIPRIETNSLGNLPINKISCLFLKSEANEIDAIFDAQLSLVGRILTFSHRQNVLNVIKKDPSVLFVKLAVREASTWLSADSTSMIPTTVPLLIDQIFNKIQRNYGYHLIKAAIAFITLSVRGISSAEMEDLLTLDVNVMKEVNAYNEAERLPSHVWIRVLSEFSGLVTESDHGCIKWYHRQLIETAFKRYSIDERIYYHKIMGQYFSGLIPYDRAQQSTIYHHSILNTVGNLQEENQQKLIGKNIPIAHINHRRCTEGGYNLVKGHLYFEAVKELCSIDMVYCCVKTGNGFALINNLLKIIDYINDKNTNIEMQEIRERAYHYLRWLQMDITFILLDIDKNMISSAYKQPLASCVKGDVDVIFQDILPLAIREWDNGTGVIRTRIVGSEINFDACLMNIIGHGTSIKSVKFNRNSTRFISGSIDGSIKTWNAYNGECMFTFLGHTNCVESLTYNIDETKILSSSKDKTIKLWCCSTGICTLTLNGHNSDVNSASYSADGLRIISCSNDNDIKIWNSITGELLSTLHEHAGWVYSALFFSNGNILSSSADKTIKLWNSMGNCTLTLKGHSDTVYTICLGFSETSVISGSNDTTIKFWNIASGECTATLRGHCKGVTSICCLNKRLLVVSGSLDKTIRIWSVINHECLRTLYGHSDKIFTLDASKCGSYIISGSRDGIIKLWETSNQAILSVDNHSSPVLCLCHSPCNLKIVSGSFDGTIKVWDAISCMCVTTLVSHSRQVYSVCYSPDGSHIVSGSWDKTVKIWDATLYSCIATLVGHSRHIYSVCCSPDGSRIVSGSWDKTVKVWDAIAHRCIFTFVGHRADVYSVCYSPDGSRIVSGSWDKTVKVWDAVAHRCIATLVGHSSHVYSVCYSPDGSRIISGSWDKTVKIWDATLCSCIATLIGHGSHVYSVCYSPDGSRIASATPDGIIILWNSSGIFDYAINVYSPITSICFKSIDSMVFGSKSDIFLLDKFVIS